MPIQTVSQFIRNSVRSKPAVGPCSNARLAHILAVVAVGGVFSSVAGAQVASEDPSIYSMAATAGTSQLNPGWSDPRLWEAVRRIWLLLDGDGASFDELATTPEAGLNLVVSRYDAFGIPTNLSSAEHDELMADINDAVCELKNESPSVDTATKTLFINTTCLMWIDLGGLVGAMAC